MPPSRFTLQDAVNTNDDGDGLQDALLSAQQKQQEEGGEELNGVSDGQDDDDDGEGGDASKSANWLFLIVTVLWNAGE